MRKLLFVCEGNVGRSQIAEAFYNKITKSTDAFSAGTDPSSPDKYPKIPYEIYKLMKDVDVNVEYLKVKTINEEFVKEAEKIIIMCEKKLCPKYLLDSPNVTFWKVKDPFGLKMDDMKVIRDEIKVKVESLIKSE